MKFDVHIKNMKEKKNLTVKILKFTLINIYIYIYNFFYYLERNVFFNFFNFPSSFLVKSRTLVFLNRRTQVKSVKNSFNMT